MRRLGVITGSGTYALAGLDGAEARTVETEFGPADVTHASFAGAEIVHVSRHGPGHPRLSNHVNHRANLAALREAGVEAIFAATICGGLEPEGVIGEVLVFDDVHFLSNRLADGSLCTLHLSPATPERGHWIFDSPLSADLRSALLAGAGDAGVNARDGGCYGHVDGPRFNTRAEIRSLKLAGVTAVSQTAGPEAMLAGEAGIPYGLIGYVTDRANGVADAAVSVQELSAAMTASAPTLSAVLTAAIPHALASDPPCVGTHYRFE